MSATGNNLIRRSMRAGMVQLAAVILAVTSCSSATEPLANVSAVVIPETVTRIVESSSGRVDVSLSFSINNPTTGMIYYSQPFFFGTRWYGAGPSALSTSPTC